MDTQIQKITTANGKPPNVLSHLIKGVLNMGDQTNNHLILSWNARDLDSAAGFACKSWDEPRAHS